jgi:protoporphyrinogen oxidase
LSRKKAIIIGAGPAGLTAAYELLTRSDVQPIVLEKSAHMGGISRTVNYKGNRIDIGGHRFFSKSDRVMQWWLRHMPMQRLPMNGNGNIPVETQRAASLQKGLKITYQNQTREVAAQPEGPDPETTDQVMLVRKRKSRIYFLRKFFDYPISLSKHTLRNLGAVRTLRIGASYARSAMFPHKNEQNLEQFFINRFGRELYETFFKSYTEKVWGVPCQEISAEWGAQRVKGLSVTKTITHFLKKRFNGHQPGDVAQKNTETSLIEQFLYPKYGPGQMWETVAQKVTELGGEIHTGIDVRGLHCDGQRVVSLRAVKSTGAKHEFTGDYFFSTMPIKELVQALDAAVPAHVREVSEGLQYRDFLTVGLLLKGLKVTDPGSNGHNGNGYARQLIEDNWIYIQEPDVLAGRLQIFNNWSPHLVSRPGTVWVGVEYFCYEGDELWRKPDAEMAEFARQELAKIGIIDADAVLDSTVIRMPKTYPAYFGAYARFDELRDYLDGFANLFLVGRNGMHKYNNQDHSMLTAIEAVDNVIAGRTDKSNIWRVNTEMEYHESK